MTVLQHSIRTQWLILSIAFVILAGVIGYQSLTAHRDITNQEQYRLQTQTRVIALNVEHQLNATNLALVSIIKDLPYLHKHENIKLTNRRLQALSDAMSGVRTLLILDKNGIVTASSRDVLIGQDFSARDYYKAPLHRGDKETLYVSPPFRSVLGPLILNLSRIIPTSDGTFGGVVVASLDPEYFRVLLNSVLYAPDMLSAINHGDGIRFLLVPDKNEPPGKNLALPGTFTTRHRESGRLESILTGKSPSYDSERIAAMRTIQPHELKLDKVLYVACTRDHAAIHEKWRSSTIIQALAFMLFSSAACFGLVLLQRRQRETALLASQAQDLLNLRLNLMEYAVNHDMQELLTQALDEVCLLSNSPIGFYHFVEQDQKTISLQAWSTRTLKEFCTAEGHGQHYPAEKAGVWADCIRQRRPIIHNDYASLASRKGLPEGHAPVIRELVVPVFRSERVVAILGIGNKPADYTNQDIELATYLAGVVWEITERKRAEESLNKSEERFRTVADYTFGWEYWTSPEGKLLYMTPSCERVTGYTAVEFNDNPELLLDCTHPDDRKKLADHLEFTSKESAPHHEVFRIITKNGETKWINHSCQAAYDSNGRFCGRRASNNDITVLKEAEANLARSNRELEQFAYVASHDLQEPLRKIAGFTELLAIRYKGTFDEKAASYMAYIVDGATRMSSLINDLLSYSRIMSSTREFTDTDCSAVLSRVQQDLELAIKESSAEIVCGALPVIKADKTQLGQLFQNLIGNAIKYRGAAPLKITISAARQQNNWLFSVTDNGIGIAPEFYDRVFAIFQRLHTRAEYPGTGIGLAVCQKIVERHGGKIWVESTEGSGATFFFTIPLANNDSERIR